MRAWLEERQLSYVLGVTAQYRIVTGHEREWGAAVVGWLPENAWRQVSCGPGSKGERRDAWTRLPLGASQGERQRWVLARRSRRTPTETADYVVSGPRTTAVERIVQVAGPRGAIAESFETANGEVGLEQYEVRSWHGWYRHVTLALLAPAYLTVIRAAAGDANDTQKKRGGRTVSPRKPSRSCR
jgi:SRSO17 transposase